MRTTWIVIACALSGCATVQLLSPPRRPPRVQSVLLRRHRKALSGQFDRGCARGAVDARIPIVGVKGVERRVQEKPDDPIATTIDYDYTFPLGETRGISMAAAWLLDPNRRVLAGAYYRNDFALGNPEQIARQLCRMVLTASPK